VLAETLGLVIVQDAQFASSRADSEDHLERMYFVRQRAVARTSPDEIAELQRRANPFFTLSSSKNPHFKSVHWVRPVK